MKTELSSTNEIPTVPDGWDRCQAYDVKKKRFCRQHPLKRSRKDADGDANTTSITATSFFCYCGNHQHLLTADTRQQQRKRIPCPIDPSHTVYEDKVEKHIQNCPLAVQRKAQQGEDYYVHNINKGGYGHLDASDVATKSSDEDALKWAQNLAIRVLQVHQKIFCKDHAVDTDPRLVSYEDILNAIPLEDLSAPIMKNLEHDMEHYRIKSGGSRHIPQLASLTGHFQRTLKNATDMNDDDDDDDSPPAEVMLLEMGAGRGIFGLTAAGVVAFNSNDSEQQQQQVHLAMVERTGTRSKAEKILRNLDKRSSTATTKNPKRKYETADDIPNAIATHPACLQLDMVQFSRIPCDIAHVDLTKVRNKAHTTIVIAKHLCGAGTDLALKSMESIDVDGCVLATCCHGVCNWKDYVGRDYLKEAMADGFGAEEFDLLRKWSAGSVLVDAAAAKTDDDDDDEHPTNNNNNNNNTMTFLGVSNIIKSANLSCRIQGLGRACQRLIDYGRKEYIEHVLFSPGKRVGNGSRLCCYVPETVTPQNAVLIGMR